MNTKEGFRQGDVFLTRIGEPTHKLSGTKVERDDDGLLTLVKGEATNHHHVFRENTDVTASFIKEEDGVKIYHVNIMKPTELQHYHVKHKSLTKEHKSIKTPPGLYEFRTQRQSSIDKRIFPVID